MRQSAWGLQWDRVHTLYKMCSGIPAFIIDDSVIAQWLSKASIAANPQRWLGLEDPNTLCAHAVLLFLMPLCILQVAEGHKQDDHSTDPAKFVYSAVVVFVHPTQVLSSIENAVDFYKLQHESMQTTPLQDIPVLPGDSLSAVLGVAHYSRCMASALLGLCLVRC